MMTVKELIEHLQSFPQDSVVGCVYLCCSDYAILEKEDLTYLPKDEITGPFGQQHKYVLRNGQITEYNRHTWDPSEVPEFVAVVAFPGN